MSNRSSELQTNRPRVASLTLLRRLAIALALSAWFALLPYASALTFSLEDVGGWPNQAHYNAAVAAAQSSIDRYNAYGDFNNINGHVYIYYEPGIPTAQANFGGSVGFGGTYPGERVMMHEMAHFLGLPSGNWNSLISGGWSGSHGAALVQQFDGLGAKINGDGAHFWPYGLNYDSEGSEINKQRQVALVYAMRADLGIGPTAHPSTATNVMLTASDPGGTSGFNYKDRWSDNYFAHAGATYSTGSFDIRTPQGVPSWTFAGDSLTVNAGGRLLYNSWGSDGVITINNLVLDGGTVRHDQFPQDHFQLNGNVTLAADSTFDAAQGDITLLGNVGGAGSLAKIGANTLTLTGTGTYSGDTVINQGTLRLGNTNPVADYTFDNVSGSTVINSGLGGGGMNGILAGGATIVSGGQSGNAVSLAGGASVDINNPITNLDNNVSWTVSARVKTSTTGASILTKGNGSGWSNGNTIFYLGDGTDGGSGGIPSGVRYAGGFFQGSTSASSVTDGTWHQVTYVNSGGNYAIYIDGVAQPLTPGNTGFGNADVGSVVRLGVSTNTVPADGTVNFNGLLDDVQFYSQSLSPQQVEALFQGGELSGSLPSGTNVTIGRGATLDLNGVVQQIGSLSSGVGGLVALGNGQLIVDSPDDSSFRGAITGSGGSLTKQGTGALTFSATSSYSGETRIAAGTLLLSGAGSIAQSELIHVNGGMLDVSNLNSTFTLAGGQQLTINSSSTVVGDVVAGSGSILNGSGVISGAVTAHSGATVFVDDGSMAMGDLTMQAGSKISFDITTPGVNDSLEILNQLTAGGNLEVVLISSAPAPGVGDSFKLLEFASASGNFDDYDLPNLASGLVWNVTELLTTGELNVVTDVDLDDDGWITGSDYLLIQETNPSLLPEWSSLYGAEVVDGESPLSSSSAVPEPASSATLVILVFIVSCRSRLRRAFA